MPAVNVLHGEWPGGLACWALEVFPAACGQHGLAHSGTALVQQSHLGVRFAMRQESE